MSINYKLLLILSEKLLKSTIFLMFNFAYCLYFVTFTIQLFKSMCHPNHCIHHLLPSDRKAKQNDKNQTFLNTKLMTSLFWWLLLLLVPWSVWTVGASHWLSPFGSVFGHWYRISQISLSHHFKMWSIYISADRLGRRSPSTIPNNNVFNSRSSGILELPHSDCIHHCFLSLYNCSYLFISSSILPFHCQNTSVAPHLKCKFSSSLFTVHVPAAYSTGKTIVIRSWSFTSIIIPLSFHIDCNSLYTAVARVIFVCLCSDYPM